MTENRKKYTGLSSYVIDVVDVDNSRMKKEREKRTQTRREVKSERISAIRILCGMLYGFFSFSWDRSSLMLDFTWSV